MGSVNSIFRGSASFTHLWLGDWHHARVLVPARVQQRQARIRPTYSGISSAAARPAAAGHARGGHFYAPCREAPHAASQPAIYLSFSTLPCEQLMFCRPRVCLFPACSHHVQSHDAALCPLSASCHHPDSCGPAARRGMRAPASAPAQRQRTHCAAAETFEGQPCVGACISEGDLVHSTQNKHSSHGLSYILLVDDAVRALSCGCRSRTDKLEQICSSGRRTWLSCA